MDSLGIYLHDKLYATPYSDIEQWDSIRRARRERSNSEKLRSEVDKSLRQSAIDSFTVFNQTNNSFLTRIKETHDAIKQLQYQLGNVSMIS